MTSAFFQLEMTFCSLRMVGFHAAGKVGDDAIAVGRIEDREVRLCAECLRLLAQGCARRGVEGADGQPLVDVPSSSLPTRSCISFAALLVKVIAAMFDGCAAVLDQVGDLLRDHARLAEPAPGEHEGGRPVEVADGFALVGR